ncbi:AraC family transcriptional regulator [Polaribacter reichenbachii]|uniref:AraC family transcriptional regulator n=1 Tax=Polaribacter reichenbachii TaxID=996801 RepID=A0A1B8TVD0_9FLAO|nr:AraC family transcriptional regulator [Polaribacter reichenbachii]APZ45515.1 AraC family transcriptional regulator [Polaribacter reichenbachii]AUC19376.1 AraC family transcriptional regulator [Polaribacter reichenbachii]OBY63469.1 AraC family transcriptional regulator [Polaribacter reichenbachii]
MLNPYQSLKLKLLNFGYDKLDHRWDFNNVISPFTRLYYITKGSAYVYHHHTKIQLLPGYLYLIPSYTYSSYKCNLSHEQYYISFFEEFGTGLSIFNFVSFNYRVKATRTDELYFRKLLELNPNRALVNNNPEYYDKYQMLMEFEERNEELSISNYLETHAILKILLSRFVDSQESLENTKNTNLDDVLTYISKNLHHNLNVSVLADYCNLSKDHFSRVFKKQYHIRPSKYIQNMLTERAMLLLITTRYSFEEIATKLGFENYNYFIRFFKLHVKKTPKEFRKEHVTI